MAEQQGRRQKKDIKEEGEKLAAQYEEKNRKVEETARTQEREFAKFDGMFDQKAMKTRQRGRSH